MLTGVYSVLQKNVDMNDYVSLLTLGGICLEGILHNTILQKASLFGLPPGQVGYAVTLINRVNFVDISTGIILQKSMTY